MLVACTGESGSLPASSGADGVEVMRDVDVGGVTVADVFVGPVVGGAPVVVMFHGTDGDPSTMEPLAREVARTGAVVHVPAWPVIDQVSPYPTNDAGPFQRQVDAVVCSLRFARRTAAEFGGDPNDLTVVGHSGGAMAGGRVAVVDELPWPDPGCDADVSHVPQRFIGTSGDYPGVNQYGWQYRDLYAPFDLMALDVTNTSLEVRLFHGFDDQAVDFILGWYFHDRLVDLGVDSRLLATDTGHSDLRDPATPAGRFVAEEVAALLHGRPGIFDDVPVDASLTADEGSCVYAGPAELALSELLRIELHNRRSGLVWFSLVGLSGDDVTVDDLLTDDSTPGGFPPDAVEFGGFQPVEVGASGRIDWVFLDGTRPWATYCLSDPDPEHPMTMPTTLLWPGSLMEPAGLLRPVE